MIFDKFKLEKRQDLAHLQKVNVKKTCKGL